MQSKYDILQKNEQEAQNTSQELSQVLEEFLAPLLLVLDALLDKRLVRSLVQCCVAIMRFRNHKQGLLLSELGSYEEYRQVLPQEPRDSVICFGPSNGVSCRLIAFCSRKLLRR